MPSRMRAALLAIVLGLAANGVCLSQASGQAASTQQWSAQWIAAPDIAPRAAGAFHFRKDFDLPQVPERFLVRVSADNRYRLFLNGALVSSGPARSDPMHWRYETVDLAPHLRRGRNVLAALVWNWGALRPVAQMTVRTGFLLSGEGAQEAIVDTNSSWRVLSSGAYSFAPVLPPDDGGYYAASPGEVFDASLHPWGWQELDYDDSDWGLAEPIGAPQQRASNPYGIAEAWQLTPRTIPAMEERIVRFARLRRVENVASDPGFIRGERALRIPAHTRATVLLDQDHLTTGYPVLLVDGGARAAITLTYAEALFDARGEKGDRDQVEGRSMRGLRDRLVVDGGRNRRIQSLWFRTFRYVQLDIETAEQPLDVRDIYSIFTAYPFEQRGSFQSADARWIEDVWDINWRMLRLSAFETYWDTPYYEQLQYVGDTRIEALITLYNAGDDRLVRNAIEQFAASRSAEGITASRYPSDPAQFIPSFSLWWIALVHDHWMLRGDEDFARQFLPGVRSVLSWYDNHIDATGLLGPLPWWNFLDWTAPFPRGVPPGAENGHSIAFSLQYAYALHQAASLEEALGQPGLALQNRTRAEEILSAVRAQAWDGGRGLFVDSLETRSFSQQTNVLAVLSGAARDPRAVMERVLADQDLTQASYYFRFYVDEAMREAGLADRYLERLQPWRDMIASGLTTTPETPDPSRSDSHAWSAHPNYHLLATVLGIRPATPGFRTVTIEPALGPLRRAEGRVPHPDGEIHVRLQRHGPDGVAARITLPGRVSGDFRWRGQTRPLRPGVNVVRL